MNTSREAHLENRYVVHSVYSQHYGNFNTLEQAERRAKEIVKVEGAEHEGYLEVSKNGIVYAIVTA